MTSEVWVVTVNGYVEAVVGSRESAGVLLERLKAEPRLNRGGTQSEWRPVGDDAWSSPAVSSLARRKWDVL